MYTDYFGLTEEPFSIAANPRFLYMSACHREALAHLLYGIRSDSGFVLLTGEVGTGKTTVCRCLLEQLPDSTDVAFILNPRLSVVELLSSICDELGIEQPRAQSSVKMLVDAINNHVLQSHAVGRNTVVIIDEAQNLSVDVLEQLRLLTNLETNERKLMRIILIGQPELATLLSRPELRQLEQRITARYHLKPLLRSEIGAYVVHRLAVAGRREPLFSARVLNKLYNRTQGIPRLINVICDRAMLGAYVSSRRTVSAPILDKAAAEVQGRSYRAAWLLPASIAGSVLLVGVATAAVLFYTNDSENRSPSASRTVQSQPAADVVPAPTLSDNRNTGSDAEPANRTLSQWPDKAAAGEDALPAAYAALFEQWKVPVAGDGTQPCTHALRHGLRCFSGVGNLGSLASTDRPAILTLLDEQGREYPATLTALHDGLATLRFARGAGTVAVEDLEARWKGRYRLLWRAAPQGYFVIRPGSRGAIVTWLTENLRAAGAGSLSVRNDYDEDVVIAVQTFQRERGLVADGVAGRQTLIHLNSTNDRSVPRLSAPVDG